MRVIKLMARLLLVFIAGILGLSLASVAGALYMRPRLADDAAPEDDELELAAIFTGREFRSTARAFRGGRLVCWYSGLDVDLRTATLSADGGDLVIWTVFGGTGVEVPEDWRVMMRGLAFFGGADSRTMPFDDLEPGPVLRIRHRTVFGGLGVVAKPQDEAVAV